MLHRASFRTVVALSKPTADPIDLLFKWVTAMRFATLKVTAEKNFSY